MSAMAMAVTVVFIDSVGSPLGTAVEFFVLDINTSVNTVEGNAFARGIIIDEVGITTLLVRDTAKTPGWSIWLGGKGRQVHLAVVLNKVDLCSSFISINGFESKNDSIRGLLTYVLIGDNSLKSFLVKASAVCLPSIDVPAGFQATSGGASSRSQMFVVAVGDPVNMGVEFRGRDFILHDNDVGIGDGICLIVDVEKFPCLREGESSQSGHESLGEGHDWLNEKRYIKD